MSDQDQQQSIADQFVQAFADAFVPAIAEAFGPPAPSFDDLSVNRILARSIGRALEAVLSTRTIGIHNHLTVPPGYRLDQAGEMLSIQPIPETEADRLFGMLALSGELGGRKTGEDSADYLRRLLDFVTVLEPEVGTDPKAVRDAWIAIGRGQKPLAAGDPDAMTIVSCDCSVGDQCPQGRVGTSQRCSINKRRAHA